jgi:hypothetical protein
VLPSKWKPAPALEGGVAIVVLQKHTDGLPLPLDENHVYSEVIENGVVCLAYRTRQGPPRTLRIPQDWVREIRVYAAHWWTAPAR